MPLVNHPLISRQETRPRASSAHVGCSAQRRPSPHTRPLAQDDRVNQADAVSPQLTPHELLQRRQNHSVSLSFQSTRSLREQKPTPKSTASVHLGHGSHARAPVRAATTKMSSIDLPLLQLPSDVSPIKAIAGAIIAWLLWRDYKRASIAVSACNSALSPETSLL